MIEPVNLGGLTLVITRPRRQGERTAQLLQGHGADTLLFPVLDIAPIPQDVVLAGFDPVHIRHADALIFVSANAVQFGMPLVRAWGGLSAQSKVFGIGRATTQALAWEGVRDALCPDGGNDSEALLALPQLQNVRGRLIVLVRGVSEGGGRALLAEALSARGAILRPLECYERQAVSAAAQDKLTLSRRLHDRAVHAFLVLSVETLDSLMENAGNMPHVLETTLLVSHERVAAAAKARNWRRVEVVPMGDDALPQALHQMKPRLLSNPTE